ncbi:ThiF family adenylyltransferase [Arthrobacter sp. RCC_34]|uniref:HesA/MoeB/ThiF family protein n=1 Tax=Arthrobacter sp. RCC_34 TaxID=3239230 RepID=UPI003524414C
MGTTTVAFTEAAWRELTSALDENLERAWVLTARLVRTDASRHTTLLVRSVLTVPDETYLLRSHDGLSIASAGWVPAFRAASDSDCLPIFVHTHPGGEPKPSSHDDVVDKQLRSVAGVRTELGHYASLVLGGKASSPAFSGRVYLSGSVQHLEVDRVRVVGERLSITSAWSSDDDDVQTEIFDRQVRAFGEAGQHTLRQLKVGVVGAGGTGSAVIEQLARLGVGELTIVDLDTLTETNVTRVYGSSLSDVDRPKVDIAAEHVKAIGLGTTVIPVHGSLLDKQVALALAHSDILFGCTDDHAGRTLLTRMPQAMLQLLIDCGVTIDSRNEAVHEIWGRVSIVSPTSPCLVCLGEIDPDKASAEQLPAAEHARRVAEGYAPELKTPDPSVVTYTSATAAFAVNEGISRVLGYSEAEPANRILYGMINRRLSTAHRPRQGTHSCGKADRIAAGLHGAFLNWGWTQ